MSPLPGVTALVSPLQRGGGVAEILVDAFRRLGTDLVAVLPSIFSGVLFLLLTGTAVTLVTAAFRVGLRTLLPDREPVYRQFLVTAVSIFLWFGVLLAAFSLLGFDAIAVSMGTTAGFLALGIGYAVSHMLKDVVSGVYLLRDGDFTPGDRVAVDGLTATVAGIGLRKSRFHHDGNTTVRRNAEVEKVWTKLDDADGDENGA